LVTKKARKEKGTGSNGGSAAKVQNTGEPGVDPGRDHFPPQQLKPMGEELRIGWIKRQGRSGTIPEQATEIPEIDKYLGPIGESGTKKLFRNTKQYQKTLQKRPRKVNSPPKRGTKNKPTGKENPKEKGPYSWGQT